MTKEEKIAVVQDLSETLAETPNIYVADMGGMTVSEVSDLRRLCFEAGVKVQVVKNTLLKKALDDAEGSYDELYSALKQQSAVFFVGENVNQPAKIIKKYRGGKKETPVLKAAYVGEAVFLGDEQLEALVKLKSKNELIGDLIGLLQSPAKNVLGALQSGGQTLAGLIKTLQEREG